MSDFARLETHDGLQVLAFVEAKSNDDDEYGPCLVTRCDPSISIVITNGPWPDDDAGWSAAEAALAALDLSKFASDAVAFAKDRFGQS